MFAVFGTGPMELLIIGSIMLLPVIVLTVIPFWLIFEKAGFPPALSLLMMLPGINVIMLFFLAFADWPSLRRSGGVGGLADGENADDGCK